MSQRGSVSGSELVRDVRVALLWSFTTACLVTFFEWPFAHGVGELVVLVAGAGLALAPARSAEP